MTKDGLPDPALSGLVGIVEFGGAHNAQEYLGGWYLGGSPFGESCEASAKWLLSSGIDSRSGRISLTLLPIGPSYRKLRSHGIYGPSLARGPQEAQFI